VQLATVTLSQARARLSELLDKVESGEEVVVTRHGRPVARIAPVAQRKKQLQPIRFEELAAFRATMPTLSQPSVELLRAMRDEER
jgi:prevent-host-death family protein